MPSHGGLCPPTTELQLILLVFTHSKSTFKKLTLFLHYNVFVSSSAHCADILTTSPLQHVSFWQVLIRSRNVTQEVAFHIFKASGSNKWNCLLFCFLSGFAARCHPVICGVQWRQTTCTIQLTGFGVYFRVQRGIKMWIDFVYWLLSKQKVNQIVWGTKVQSQLIDFVSLRVSERYKEKCVCFL